MKHKNPLIQLLAENISALQAIDLPASWVKHIPAYIQIQTEKQQPQNQHDCLVWYQGLQQLRQLDYFNCVADSLHINGQLIAIEPLHLDDTYLLAQAQRCGFKLISEQKYQKKNIRVFEKHKQMRWRTQHLDKTQQQAIRDLFIDVFKTKMDKDLWDWKYAEGRGVATGVWYQDKLIAHYGGMYKRLSYFGKKQWGFQIGDVMVTAKQRGYLTRQGPFYLSVTSFLEQYVGYGRKALVPYGFPSARAVKIAERLGVYQAVDHILELQWQQATEIPTGYIQTWQQKPKWQQRLFCYSLWQQMQKQQRQHIIGIRDWAYIQHRYLQHPDKTYDLLWFSQNHFPQALLIIHRGTDMCRLMDYIGRQQHIKTALAALSHYLAQQGIEQISGWFSQYAADCLSVSHAKTIATDIILPVNSWSNGPSVSELKGHWWLSTGDTDFL